MKIFKPNSFEEAVEIATGAEGITRFLAGGTDVIVQLRTGLVTPDTLIDLKGIAEVKRIIQRSNGSWDIGIAVTGAELSEHPTLSKNWPGLVEAVDLIGSTQVQGRATLVGNLCNGSPAADSVPAMIAAGVTLTVQGPNGTRRLKVEDIPTGPGRTSLTKGEVVACLHIPARPPGGGDAYQRFIPRTEMDIAVVGCGINLTVDGDTITDARVAIGAVAPTVRLVPDAARLLIGSTLDDATLDGLVTAVRAACAPIDDKRGTIEFRIEVAGVIAKRVARTAYERARAAK